MGLSWKHSSCIHLVSDVCNALKLTFRWAHDVFIGIPCRSSFSSLTPLYHKACEEFFMDWKKEEEIRQQLTFQPVGFYLLKLGLLAHERHRLGSVRYLWRATMRVLRPPGW